MSHRSVLDDDDRSAYASSLHRPMMPAGRQGPPSPAASTSSGSLTFVNLGSASGSSLSLCPLTCSDHVHSLLLWRNANSAILTASTFVPGHGRSSRLGRRCNASSLGRRTAAFRRWRHGGGHANGDGWHAASDAQHCSRATATNACLSLPAGRLRFPDPPHTAATANGPT